MAWITGIYEKHGKILVGTLAVGVFLLLWEAANPFLDPLILTVPSRIAKDMFVIAINGELAHHAFITMTTFAYGYAAAAVIAIPLGIIMGRLRIIEYVVDPFVTFLYATPKVAILPLLIVMFGIGFLPKVTLAFLGVFFPLLINSLAGAKNVDPLLIEVSSSFNISKMSLWTKVVLPYTLPFIFAGLRLGIGIGLIMVIVGEFWASNAGLGYMIMIASTRYDTSRVLSGVVFLAIGALILTKIVEKVQSRLPWLTHVS